MLAQHRRQHITRKANQNYPGALTLPTLPTLCGLVASNATSIPHIEYRPRSTRALHLLIEPATLPGMLVSTPPGMLRGMLPDYE